MTCGGFEWIKRIDIPNFGHASELYFHINANLQPFIINIL
jgi:hypothetical protein